FADHCAVLVVEAALLRPIFLVRVAQMPFANDRGFVAGFLQALWHEPFAGIESVARSGWDNDRLQSITKRIPSGHQRRARRRAHWLDIELSELRTGRGQLVDVRRFDVGRAIESDIFPTEVISHDVNDVWFGVRSSEATRACEHETEKNVFEFRLHIFESVAFVGR